MIDHKKSGIVAHSHGLLREFTLCGLAMDSSLNIEGFEWLNTTQQTKPNCKNCIDLINFCKSIPKSSLSKKLKNCDR